MNNTVGEMALIEAGVRQLEVKIKEYERTIEELKDKLRLEKMNEELSLSRAGEIAGTVKSTIHNWKNKGLKSNANGKIMRSDLIEFLATHNPNRVRQLGYDPENFKKTA